MYPTQMTHEVKLTDVNRIPIKRGVKWPQLFGSLEPGETKKVENATTTAARSALRYHHKRGRFLDIEVTRRGDEVFLRRKEES